MFPKLWRIASSKSTIVTYLREGGEGGGHWLVQFRRSFQDWEMEELTQLLDLIYPMRVQEGEETLL